MLIYHNFLNGMGWGDCQNRGCNLTLTCDRCTWWRHHIVGCWRHILMRWRYHEGYSVIRWGPVVCWPSCFHLVGRMFRGSAFLVRWILVIHEELNQFKICFILLIEVVQGSQRYLANIHNIYQLILSLCLKDMIINNHQDNQRSILESNAIEEVST